MSKELLKIARGFRKGMLSKKPSKEMCFAICAPLLGYLQFCGYDCLLIQGTVGDWEHYWIELPGGKILDPSADQFDNTMPDVYCGELPDNYIID